MGRLVFARAVVLMRGVSVLPVIGAFSRAALDVWTHCTLALVGRIPGVRWVAVRGSYARGTYRHFWSDIDLAVCIRETPVPQAARADRKLLNRLSWVQRLNPAIRDPWQLLFTESEDQLFRRFWPGLALHEWVSHDARFPSWEPQPVSRAFVSAVLLNRQFFWAGEQARRLLDPRITPYERTALRRKNAYFAFMAREMAEGRDAMVSPQEMIAASARARDLSLGEVAPPEGKAAFAQSMAELHDTVEGLEPCRFRSKAISSDRTVVIERQQRSHDVLRALEGSSELRAHVDALYWAQGALNVVLDEPATELVEEAWNRFVPHCHRWSMTLVVLTKATQRIAPCWEPKYVALGDDIDALAGPPLLAWEQLLFDSLFLPCHARMALRSPKPAKELSSLFWKMAQRVLLFETGHLSLSDYSTGRALAARPSVLTGLPSPAAERGELSHLLAETCPDRWYEWVTVLGQRLTLLMGEAAALHSPESR